LLCFVLTTRPPAQSPLFPYTTLFRSGFAWADPFGDESGERILVYHGGRARVAHPQMGDRRSTGWACLPRGQGLAADFVEVSQGGDRKSTRLNSSHVKISYAVFCLKKK